MFRNMSRECPHTSKNQRFAANYLDFAPYNGVRTWQTKIKQTLDCALASHTLAAYRLARHRHDTVSERLRRWTRNPLGSARRGSNPLGVVLSRRTNASLVAFAASRATCILRKDLKIQLAKQSLQSSAALMGHMV